ncbi:hypothetical protein V2G26_008300 [Clonostachys chloroleuca]
MEEDGEVRGAAILGCRSPAKISLDFMLARLLHPTRPSACPFAPGTGMISFPCGLRRNAYPAPWDFVVVACHSGGFCKRQTPQTIEECLGGLTAPKPRHAVENDVARKRP